jgi:hypothetical protein
VRVLLLGQLMLSLEVLKRGGDTEKVHGYCLVTGTRGTRAAALPVCSASRRTIERSIVLYRAMFGV